MVYVVTVYLGSVGNDIHYGRYRCVGISSTIQGARRMSMDYIGKSRLKDTQIMKIPKEMVKKIGVVKGETFVHSGGYLEQIFLPKTPMKYITVKEKWEYFIDSKGDITGKATDSYGRPYYILAKSQETI